MTDKKTPLTTEPTKKSDSKAPEAAKKSGSKASEPTKKPDSKAPETTKKSSSKAPVTNTTATKPSHKEAATSKKEKVSKLAIFALIVAIVLTIIHYFWQLQQSQALTIKLSEQIDSKNTATFNQYQAQIKQVMNEQQKNFTNQLQQVASRVNNTNQEKISELNTIVNRLENTIKQRQPSDWLLHEAEYLIRMAARTLWLENDTTASIGLLKDADTRLADLNDPAFLPVRELVHMDIKSLELMPVLQTDEVVLTLMAMKTQLPMLPLAMVDVGTDANTGTELSDNLNDWRKNLAKTWEKFLDDFIRVRQRTGLIKPLVSPKQQQHLKQNLNLKIQLALWAATEKKGDIYQKSLVDIKQWITEFFDLKDPSNQQFLAALTKLQAQRISYNYPSDLSSLTAIRTALKTHATLPQVSPVSNAANAPDKESVVEKAKEVLEEKQPVVEKVKEVLEEKQPAVEKVKEVLEEKQPVVEEAKEALEEKQPAVEKVKEVLEEKQSSVEKAEPVESSPSPKQQGVQLSVEGKI